MFSVFLDTGYQMPQMPERPPWWEVLIYTVIDFLIIARVFITETVLYFSPGFVTGLGYAYATGASYLLCCCLGSFISLCIVVSVEESFLALKRYVLRSKRQE